MSHKCHIINPSQKEGFFCVFLCRFEGMKNLLLFLLLIPNFIFGQYVTIPTHYNSEQTAQHIMQGHIKMFLKDTAVWTVEKKNERYVTSWYSPEIIKIKLNKVFERGKLEYISRRNGGYIFTIAVVDPIDNTKVINYCTFHVDGRTQKIEEIEILLGE